MYIGHGRLSIFNTEGGMRNFLITTTGVVAGTTQHMGVKGLTLNLRQLLEDKLTSYSGGL